jgi:hypothetical protein
VNVAAATYADWAAEWQAYRTLLHDKQESLARFPVKTRTQAMQNSAARLICAIGPRDHVTPSLRELY